MTATATSGSWCSASAVAEAARACAKRKHGRAETIAFRLHEGQECLALAERLEAGTYVPEPGRVFVTERPKHREVHAAAYRDRVVHHLLHALVEPLFEPHFSEASFACRRGKGTHAAAVRLRERMADLSRRGGVRVWALQMDVVNFFMSLHKPTLLALLGPTVKAAETRLASQGRLPESGFGPWELCRRIVENEAFASGRRVGARRLFARVPPHKRLGALGADRGIPIGNLTSQFFANVYLSPLDHFVTRTLGVGAYVRYVDDIVLLASDRARLVACEARIRAFLAERLLLDVRAKSIAPASAGVDFLGYVIRPSYALPRRRVVRSLVDALGHAEMHLRPIEIPAGVRLRLPRLGGVRGPLRAWRLDHDAIEKVRALWASYDGHFVHARAHHLRERLWQRHPNVARMLAREGGRITRRFALSRPVPCLAAQVTLLARGTTDPLTKHPAVLLVQVGRFVEAHRGGQPLGLRLRRLKRRAARGAPWVAAARLIQRALSQGQAVAVALEGRESAGNVKQRRLAYLFEPVSASSDVREPSV